MASLVLKMSVSLDGYVAPPDGSSDWIAAGRSDDVLSWTVETVSNAGAHLMGATTYAGWAVYWPGASGPFARPMNEIPKVVFSDSLQSADWGETTIATGHPGPGHHTAQAGALRRIPARPRWGTVRAVAGQDRLDRRVPPGCPSGRSGRGRVALPRAAHHRADEHHRLQRRRRGPRLRGAPVMSAVTFPAPSPGRCPRHWYASTAGCACRLRASGTGPRSHRPRRRRTRSSGHQRNTRLRAPGCRPGSG
jgi:hypothetical protein